jgi:hypothetical protein
MYVELSLRRDGRKDGAHWIIFADNLTETKTFEADKHAREKDAL